MRTATSAHSGQSRRTKSEGSKDYANILRHMVALTTRALGLPATASQVKEHNAEAIAQLPESFGVLLSHYLPKLADGGSLKRWRAPGKRLSFYAPANWHGALPPELPPSLAARVLQAIRVFRRHHPLIPFSVRDIAEGAVPAVCTAVELSSCITSLATQERLVRVGHIGSAALYYEADAYEKLTSTAKRGLRSSYNAAACAPDAQLTLVGAISVLAQMVTEERIREASPRDRPALLKRPISTAEFANALRDGRSVGRLNKDTLREAIASATAKKRVREGTALRCVGSIGTKHFYSLEPSSHVAWMDLQIAAYQLQQLLDCSEHRTLLRLRVDGRSASGVMVPRVVGAARFAEFAARLQWRREHLSQMPWRTLLTSAEVKSHEALVGRALDAEAELSHAVRAFGGDAIQLISYVPDIPDDGALVPTLQVEKAGLACGVARSKSARDLSGRLAQKLGAVERTVSSRVEIEARSKRKGGRARVYLRRSRVLCHLINLSGGPTWSLVGAYAGEVLGDLSDSDVFCWVLEHGSDHDMMLAAAALAILDSMRAREGLASFLAEQCRLPQRASAAMEFAIVGLARKPLLPRATGLEFTHRDLLRDLRRDPDRRIARLALWTLNTWEQPVSDAELIRL